jgi:hypothetical protein
MLPPEYHEQACELFCRILIRLEERDKRHDTEDSSTITAKSNCVSVMEAGATDELCIPSVPSRQQSRTKEKRLSRDAAG